MPRLLAYFQRSSTMFRALMLVVFLTAIGATPAEAGRRVALVIGNSAYDNFPELANPTHDADGIASTLRRIGFDVVVPKDNVDEREFVDLLSDFSATAEGADIALFYYSGHGLQYQSENYLLPIDAALKKSLSLTHEAVPLNEVLQALSIAHTALVFIDACRSCPGYQA